MQKKIKEHKEDIKKGRISMVLVRLNAEKRVEIDFQHTKKLANFENFNHSLERGSGDSHLAQTDQPYGTCIDRAGLVRNDKEQNVYAKKKENYPK